MNGYIPGSLLRGCDPETLQAAVTKTPAPCRFTVEQLTRLHAIVDAWNAVRRDEQRRASATEVIDFMLTQEEESIAAMCANDAAETRAELAREDLADEKPLPPVTRTRLPESYEPDESFVPGYN